jgi:hypothetical protein
MSSGSRRRRSAVGGASPRGIPERRQPAVRQVEGGRPPRAPH